MQATEQRIERLERLVADLDARVTVTERTTGAAVRGTPQAAPRPEPEPRPQPEHPPRPTPWPEPAPRMPRLELGREDLEDLLGGRVLAWVGGIAVLLGIVFLFALAISNGWIGETARVVLGGAGSAGLLALGVWLHERKARGDAALASVATGVSGLFVTITVAAQVYALVSPLSALVLAVGAGAIATALAVRWESRGIAALGILGAIGAPVIVGAGGEGGSLPILFVALASAAGVVLWQRWDWLALAAFAIATPQWVAYLLGGPGIPATLATLAGFGALGVAVAIGHELRIRAKRLRGSSAYLFALNGLVVAGAGFIALGMTEGTLYHGWDMTRAGSWLAAVAAVHLGLGLLGARLERVSLEIRLVALAIGVVLADVAFGVIVDGPALAIGWAATAVGFAALVRHAARGEDGAPAPGLLAETGLGGHVALSMLSAYSLSDPGEVLAGAATLGAGGAAALVALAAACLVSALIARNRVWRLLLEAVGLGTVALLTAMTFDGLGLVLAWAAEVVVLAAIARRTRDEGAAWGALGFLALAAIHALAFDAPPVSLVTGLADPAAAIAAVAAIAGCLVLMASWTGERELATRFHGGAALAVLYLASALVVTPFESNAAVDSALLSAHQQGQMVLSVFWGLVGVGTIVVGLRRDLGIVRIAGLALLAVTVGKLFLFDLATLTSVYRVVSFIGLGLLLLGGAFVWQRLRPRQLSDLRETPAAVR